jgi:ABC-type multidrug transport system fused ATPase/permease subunit
MYFINILFEFAKKHPILVLINLSFMALMPVNEILLPHMYGKLIDSIQHKKSFIKYFVFVISALIIVQIGYSIGDWHDTKVNPEFQSFLRQKMLGSIIDKYENCYEDITSGDVITKFVKTPGILIQWFARVKDYLIPYTLVFVCAVIYFMYYDIVLGINLMVTMIIMVYLLITSPFKCKKQTVEKSKIYNQLHEEIDDVLRNLMSVYGSNEKDKELARISELDDKHKTAFMNTMLCILKYKFISIPIIIIFFGIFVYRCNKLIHMGKLKTANFVSLFMIILYMMGSLMWLVDIMRDVIFDWGMIKETENLLEYDKKLPKHLQLAVQPPPNGIGLYNVTFKYEGAVEPTISNVSIYFKPGETTILMGDIGSGKSTILKLLMRFYLPQDGDMFIDGKWYADLKTYQIRRNIGYVQQIPILFNRSVYENIKYGNPNITNEQIDNVIYDLEIEKEFINLKDGLNTPVGKNGNHLSGGQKQLVMTLRILLQNPDYLFLDEPTASMDTKTKEVLFRLLDKIMSGGNPKTVIMITHDPYLLKKANRKIYLKNGQISEYDSSKHTNI